jgi:hypothetical protein
MAAGPENLIRSLQSLPRARQRRTGIQVTAGLVESLKGPRSNGHRPAARPSAQTANRMKEWLRDAPQPNAAVASVLCPFFGIILRLAVEGEALILLRLEHQVAWLIVFDLSRGTFQVCESLTDGNCPGRGYWAAARYTCSKRWCVRSTLRECKRSPYAEN